MDSLKKNGCVAKKKKKKKKFSMTDQGKKDEKSGTRMTTKLCYCNYDPYPDFDDYTSTNEYDDYGPYKPFQCCQCKQEKDSVKSFFCHGKCKIKDGTLRKFCCKCFSNRWSKQIDDGVQHCATHTKTFYCSQCADALYEKGSVCAFCHNPNCTGKTKMCQTCGDHDISMEIQFISELPPITKIVKRRDHGAAKKAVKYMQSIADQARAQAALKNMEFLKKLDKKYGDS